MTRRHTVNAMAGRMLLVAGIWIPLLAGQPSVEHRLREKARLQPDSFEANRQLGAYYAASRRIDSAIPYLEIAQRIDPSNYENEYDLALAYLNNGQLDKARGRIRHMLTRRDTAELHNLLGSVEGAAGHQSAAAEQFQRAAEMDPSEEHLFNYGNALTRYASDAAVRVFRFGVERYPRSSRLRAGLGVALYSRGLNDEAIETLCQAVDLDLSDPRSLKVLGELQGVSPALSARVNERLLNFVRRYPRNAFANYYYALSLRDRRSGEESISDPARIEQLLKTAIQLDPRLAGAHFQLGLLYEERGLRNEAIRLYERAVDLDPRQDQYHYRLGREYKAAGEETKALEQLRIYRRLHSAKLQAVSSNK